MKSLSIKNYKNLRDLKIDSLSKVNLIVGMNNSGKSTLLEAISIYATNGDINHLKRILDSRGISSSYAISEEEVAEKELDNYLSLFTDKNVNLHNPIEICINKQECKNKTSIKLVNVEENWITDSTGDSVTKRRIVEDGENINPNANLFKGLSIIINNEPKQLYLFRNYRSRYSPISKLLPCEYVQTLHISSEKNPFYYDSIAMSTLEDELIKSLNIIDSQIDAINFLEDYKKRANSTDRVPYIVYKGSSKRYRLSTMGDGINRILTIILAMLNCKDGVFLVDEFDNGLHYSVQTKLWKMIYRLAENLNIQVFATTHSDDCIKSFIEADENGDGKLIRLENRGGDITAVEFNDKDRLVFAINNDVEVR